MKCFIRVSCIGMIIMETSGIAEGFRDTLFVITCSEKLEFEIGIKYFKKRAKMVLTLSQTSPCFVHVCITSLLKKTWEKEKLLVTSNFPSPMAFSTTLENFLTFSSKFKIVVCKLFQFGRVLNLSFGKGLIYQLLLQD